MKPPRSATDAYLLTWTALANLYSAGRLAEAAELARALEDEHPERRSHIRHARACLAALMGDVEGALALMRQVVDNGSWWAAHELEDTDLDSLRSRAEFFALTSEMAMREGAAIAAAAPQPQLIMLSGEAPARTLVVALHMYGVSAEETAQKWRPVAQAGTVVAVPESTQRDGDGLPCWTDDGTSERAVLFAAGELRSAFPDHAAPLILAGASQGAGRAIRMVLADRVDGCAGFIGIVGAPAVAQIDPTGTARLPRTRGFLIAGGEDAPSREAQQRLHDHLIRRNVATRLVVVDGLGHQYPANFSDLIEEAVDFITGESERVGGRLG